MAHEGFGSGGTGRFAYLSPDTDSGGVVSVARHTCLAVGTMREGRVTCGPNARQANISPPVPALSEFEAGACEIGAAARRNVGLINDTRCGCPVGETGHAVRHLVSTADTNGRLSDYATLELMNLTND